MSRASFSSSTDFHRQAEQESNRWLRLGRHDSERSKGLVDVEVIGHAQIAMRKDNLSRG